MKVFTVESPAIHCRYCARPFKPILRLALSTIVDEAQAQGMLSMIRENLKNGLYSLECEKCNPTNDLYPLAWFQIDYPKGQAQ